MSDPVIIAMATFPPRKEGMLTVVNALLPQCDKFYLYLNGYTIRPPELPDDERLNIILAGPGCEHPDVGSHGKFYWLGNEDGYYLSVDDDIFYPPNYATYMVEGIDKYQRRAIVGLHGGLYRVRPGGPLPPKGFAKDHRTLYAYDKTVSHDTAVHILGAGVMGVYPKALGLTSAVCTEPIHSGDDEDIAIWAQKNKVPLIRLQGYKNWVTPNPTEWIRDPLHRRMAYIQASDAKLKTCKSWIVHQPPALRQTPISIPVKHGTTKPKGPSFDNVFLTDEDKQFCEKIISSDALAALVVDRIKRRIPTSVIRMSDGERGVIAYSQTGKQEGFMLDQNWLRRYGLLNVDFKKVGEDLLWAGHEADFLACTISGIFWDCFRVNQYFPERTRFIDQFYPQLWTATDRVGAVLRAGPVLVLHREHARITSQLINKYGITATGLLLNSWRDHKPLLDTLTTHPATTVLVSGGASGKAFCVRLAKATGKVVLDVGEALTSTWLT